jgi:hypothetical protein
MAELNFKPLIGKSVKIVTTEPIKTHFSQNGTKVLYGHLDGETKQFIQIEIGAVEFPKEIKQQVHIISKDIIKSVYKEWLMSVSKGNKEWYKPTTDYIPARDDRK